MFACYVYIVEKPNHNYHLCTNLFYLVVRMLKIYPFSNFKIYNMLLLTVVTMQFNRLLIFILPIKTLSLSITVSSFPIPPYINLW
jgi:hypothetical protein